MTAAETPTLPPAPPSAPSPAPALDAIDVTVLRGKWSQLAGEVGRDLESGNSVTVARSMQQLANLEAYIALVESHQHAHRPKWRQWEFWRRIILALAIVLTLTLLFMAFTHPSRVDVRIDVLASSIAFTCDEEIRLPIGARFETISVNGLERLEFPTAQGQRVISGKGITVSNAIDGAGRLDWITIPAGATLRLRSSDREIGVSVSTPYVDDRATAPKEPRISTSTAIRWNMAADATMNVLAGEGVENEPITFGGGGSAMANIEGLAPASSGHMEVTILLARDAAGNADPLRLSRLSGAHISNLICTDDNEVAVRRRSTIIEGEVRFPDVEVPPAVLDEATRLTVSKLDASLVRVELLPGGVHVICEGEAGDVRAGRDEQRSLLPSRLEYLFARRFRMYVTGVLLYAVVFIVALLKGDKASIGEGFQPRSLMKMVHGGGHL